MAFNASEKENDKEELDALEFASAVLTGTVIGRSLGRALESLASEDSECPARSLPAHDSEDGSDKNDGSSSDTDMHSAPVRDIRLIKQSLPSVVRMDGSVADEILRAFREGIADSRISHRPEADGAPQILLRGRCDHYNRYGQNWMVAMDSVKLKARPNKFTKRRRDDRPSLWDRDDDGGTASEKELQLNEKIQLLACGDI